MKHRTEPIRSKTVGSHPAGVRGLKHLLPTVIAVRTVSHPAGVRGLKRARPKSGGPGDMVAPRRGAWIETYAQQLMEYPAEVAPRRGAWIETLRGSRIPKWVVRRTPQGCVD